MVQVFLKKWWVESDFKAPNLPLSLRLKVSGCHYNSIYINTWTKQVKQLSKAAPNSVKKMSKILLRHTSIKTIFLTFLLTPYHYPFSLIWSLFFYRCVHVKSNGGNWGHRWWTPDLPIPHLHVVNSIRIHIYRQ